MHTYISLQGVCVSSQGFLFGGLSGVFLSGRFRPGWFLSVPLLSEHIHYNRKLNITFNFRFHMYEILFKCVTSHALGPLTCSWTPHPLSQTVTHFWTPSHPSSVTYFMDGPICILQWILIYRAHSFPRAAEFRAEPRNLGFCRGIRAAEFTAEFVFLPRNLTFFIRTTILSQKITSK